MVAPKETILIIEDERDIRELLKFQLQQEGFKIETAESGEQALRILKTSKISLILLDLMLPGMDGLEICQRLKAKPKTRDIPIIILTAKSSETDIIKGLGLGADDYVGKPFSAKVLVARIRTVLRRPSTLKTDTPVGPVLQVGDLLIDPSRHKAEIKGKDINLTHTEFRILQILAANPGYAFPRQQIVDHIRGESYAVTERIIDVQIVSLRKKMGSLADWIETVRSVGYRFKEV
ncbi:MAG: response regulator transcription factor [Verrucomicrobiota bacterium]|jgi:two-component system phosphate regulon response regulator PhoB|nr:response regulator transcription factor [Verrucomicrobiota bacterium]